MSLRGQYNKRVKRGEIRKGRDKTREGKNKKRIRNAVGDKNKEGKGQVEKWERCAKMGKDEEKSKQGKRSQKRGKTELGVTRYLGIV